MNLVPQYAPVHPSPLYLGLVVLRPGVPIGEPSLIFEVLSAVVPGCWVL
jgi:hypothetical protein